MKKELTIVINKEEIEKQILALKDAWSENTYVYYGESQAWDDPYLTKEEYEKYVDEFLADFRKSVADPDDLIAGFPKKKNGTFNRRNSKELTSCGNCIAIHEWHNTWIYKIIKLRAADDTTLHVFFTEEVDTPA